jgi:hypothetical protein
MHLISTLLIMLIASTTVQGAFPSECKVISQDVNREKQCVSWYDGVAGEYEYEYENLDTCVSFKQAVPKLKSTQNLDQLRKDDKYWCATEANYDGTTLKWGVCERTKLPASCFPLMATKKPTTGSPTPPTRSQTAKPTTRSPTFKPGTTRFPTRRPTNTPTNRPTTLAPTPPTTFAPTTPQPTNKPSLPTKMPTIPPTKFPGATRYPTVKAKATSSPTSKAPTLQPTTAVPSLTPTTSTPTRSPRKTRSPTRRSG